MKVQWKLDAKSFLRLLVQLF